MKTLTLTLSMLMVLGTTVLLGADGNMPKDQTVWDRIGEDHVQVVGYVTFVNDETFELRSPEKGALTFAIPDDQDGVMAHIASGKRVQVWYDPSLDTDGLTGRVTYVESYDLLPEEGEIEGQVEQTFTEVETETEELVNETEAELEETGDEIEREAEEALAETEAALESDRSTNRSQTGFSDDLPQTASSAPTSALTGLFLMGLGALVWGGFRRS